MENVKVLIIDDEEAICESMKDMLEGKGYTVLVTSNGVDGLKACAAHKIDLIILDLNMPRMDGYMFLERLKNRWEKEKIEDKFPAVIVLTATDPRTDLGLSKNLGATKYMLKPFKSSEFYEALQDALKK